MSKMAELDMVSYDIEQLFLDGLTEKNIAKTLDISVEMVYAWMQLNGITQEDGTYYGA
jgi:DNA-binding CsgD family transcriptional regulator